MKSKGTNDNVKKDTDVLGTKRKIPKIKCKNCGTSIRMFVNDPVLQQPLPFCGKCETYVDVVEK